MTKNNTHEQDPRHAQRNTADTDFPQHDPQRDDQRKNQHRMGDTSTPQVRIALQQITQILHIAFYNCYNKPQAVVLIIIRTSIEVASFSWSQRDEGFSPKSPFNPER